MLFKWLDTTKVDALAQRLVEQFREQVPLADYQSGGKKAEARLRQAHDELLRQAKEFAATESLNLYKKSRLANRVKWALRDAGYPSKNSQRVLANKLGAAFGKSRRLPSYCKSIFSV